MKRAVILLISLILCLSIVACGNNEVNPSVESPENGEVCWDILGYATPNAFEIVDSYSEVFAVSHGYYYIRTFVTVKNVSDYPLGMSLLDGYSVYKNDDTLAFEASFDSIYPQYVLPGECAYLYSYHMLDENVLSDNETKLRCEPEIDSIRVYHNGQKAEDIYIYYEVSDVELSAYDAEGTRLQLTGTIDLTGSEDSDSIFFNSVGFDKRGTPVCFFNGMFNRAADTFPTDKTADFAIRGEVYGSLTVDDIAYYSPIEAYSTIK